MAQTFKPLKKGDLITIVTPSYKIDSARVVGLADFIESLGYRVNIADHVYGKAYLGTYPATHEQRAADIMQAVHAPEVNIIMCSRGGYGAIHLLPYLDLQAIHDSGKPIVGYSDITVLHAIWKKAGVPSVHGQMAEMAELSDKPGSHFERKLFAEGLPIEYRLPAHKYNRHGKAEGKMYGGNFVTFNELAETPIDFLANVDSEPIILFVEEVGEHVRMIERMLTRLYLAGKLQQLQGIVFGQFTEYDPAHSFDTMEDMIDDFFRLHEMPAIPIVFDFPSGHTDINYPLVFGVKTTLESNPQGVTLRFENED